MRDLYIFKISNKIENFGRKMSVEIRSTGLFALKF